MTDRVTAIIRRLSSAFRQDTESNNYKITRMPADELDELENILEDIRDAHLLDYATGQSLDYIADLLELSREGLSDADFRALIGSTVVFRMSNGTLDDIKNVVSVLSGVDTNKITIVESDDDNAFSIRIEESPSASFTLTSFNKNINSTKAAGVKYLHECLIIYLAALWERHIADNDGTATHSTATLLCQSEFIFGNSYFGDATFGDPCETHRSLPGEATLTSMLIGTSGFVYGSDYYGLGIYGNVTEGHYTGPGIITVIT
ncbi:MAG: hypothetical protein JXQ82_07615 [Methanomicrobiaceae archaeon]|nr:hypothetical protein [Methanomicrobiaceae archaeon]